MKNQECRDLCHDMIFLMYEKAKEHNLSKDEICSIASGIFMTIINDFYEPTTEQFLKMCGYIWENKKSEDVK